MEIPKCIEIIFTYTQMCIAVINLKHRNIWNEKNIALKFWGAMNFNHKTDILHY